MILLKNIGLPVKPPEKTCNDPLCPFHGRLSVRGILQEGKVVSCKAKNLVVVEKELVRFSKKYNRYYKVRKKIHARLPDCLHAELGDNVLLAECRPLSKTVSFVVIENRGGK
ncbi:MAG: 30S ribosomal protein S17 [Nitrososphaeria archaeon]